MMIQTKDTTEMKTEVKSQKKSVCALLMNQANAVVIALHGVATEKMKVMMILITTKENNN